MANIQLAKPSLQSLLIQMSVNGNGLSTGTGFVCESKKGPVLITNWHNVTGLSPHTRQPLSPTGGLPDSITIIHNQKGHLGNWVSRTQLLKGRSPWIEHPTLGDKADFVALPLTEIDDVELYPYELGDQANVAVRPADPVSVVGFPFGLQGGGSLAIWATGFLASEPDIDFHGLPMFLVDCRTRQGQSGSAVIFHSNGGILNMADGSSALVADTTTKLLGVYSGRINDQSDLGMVWKASAIAELVDSI
ncbi:hypothetical protein BH10PSE6_BH10PSE6_55100 [soil metagenome]